ncbi:hypothetical protein [Halogeometricum sp. CBA1124]|uniref:hypothetical protein n=1 Tax=Halogeometricum sp. CBA1124 TaxID=2668071 RepID=UPI00142C524E|nr:hypothetical protein [Halogeometricum sp. CBA1124]MUV56258.1 copper amine oxidase [Halogeometricum sp. CBA1124]
MSRIVFKLNGSTEIASIDGSPGQSYEKEIAGPESSRGPISLGDMVWAVVPSDPVDKQIDLFSIGSQEQPSIPFHLQGLSAGTVPNIENSDLLERSFEQEVDGRKTVFTTKVPDVLYQYYQNRKRTLDWGGYVSDGYDDPYIDSIVKGLREFGERNGHSDSELLNHAVALVQQMEYTQDKVATGYNEYPKYPIETLVDRGGDCEDSCILLAQLLKKLGYDTVLLVIRDAQHMALGVAGDNSLSGSYYEHGGRRYYYLETTAGGWKVGQVPQSVRNSNGKAEIHEVNSRPVLAHKWATQVSPEGGVTVEVGLRNVGDAPATTAEVETIFETPDRQVVSSKKKSSPEVGVDSYGEVSLQLVPPDTKELHGRVRIFLDGELHDESVSEFRKPTKLGQ